jgi:predicted CoA-binding protein
MAFQNPSNDELTDILLHAKKIAVVGLSDKPDRTSYMVSEVMQKNGFTIIPVNPRVKEVLGEKSASSLVDIDDPVDIINVFRRSEDIMPVAEAAVKYGKAKVLWLQQGIYNEEAAVYCEKHGMTVIMDRCIKVDYAMLVPRN